MKTSILTSIIPQIYLRLRDDSPRIGSCSGSPHWSNSLGFLQGHVQKRACRPLPKLMYIKIGNIYIYIYILYIISYIHIYIYIHIHIYILSILSIYIHILTMTNFPDAVMIPWDSRSTTSLPVSGHGLEAFSTHRNQWHLRGLTQVGVGGYQLSYNIHMYIYIVCIYAYMYMYVEIYIYTYIVCCIIVSKYTANKTGWC